MENDSTQTSHASTGTHFTLITATNNNSYSKITVPDQFKKKVLTHVISHYLEDNSFFLPPIFLAIEGPAGEGKTSQTIASLTQRDIDVVYVSGSNLSGSHESEASDIMMDIYNFAKSRRKNNTSICIVIDDFHMSIINQDDNIKKTINSNLLTGFFMNLTNVSPDNTVPIILTGNDFSQVYAPLLRSGRADIFRWNPDYNTKFDIVQKILEPIIINFNSRDFKKFFDQFQAESIADFTQLKNDCRKKHVWEIIKNENKLNFSSINRINSQLSSSIRKVSFEELRNMAIQRSKEHKKSNN